MPTGIYKRKPFSEEARKHMSDAQKGKRLSEKTKEKISKALTGKHLSEKHRENIGKGGLGRQVSQETRDKLSRKHKGRVFSEETKRKMSEALRKNWKNSTYRAKLVNAHIGHKPSEETRAKMSKVRRGVKRPDITGKNHPGWRGGTSKMPYAFDFNKELKNTIRSRDGFKCQLCGRTEKEEQAERDRVLPVHHIDYNKMNSKENNLITLCHICNSRVNFDRLDWMKFFEKKIQVGSRKGG